MSSILIRRAWRCVFATVVAALAASAMAGTIEGTVTSSANGSALQSASVVALPTDLGGGQFFAPSDGGGGYVIDVPAGSYFVVAAKNGYASELYQELPCCDGGTAGATIITVDSVGSQTGIHFTLTPQAPPATVSGVVRSASGNAPLAGITINAIDANQSVAASTTSAADGSYTLSAPAGAYVIATSGAPDPLLDERYPEVQCRFGSCVGTPTTFELASGATQTGIDFALAPIATLTLGLNSAATAAAINGVIGYRRNGEPLGAVTETSVAAGSATIEIFGGGTIYVAAASNECGPASDQACLSELNPGLPCAHFSCDFSAGNAIVIAKGQSLSGPDFVLDVGARISGTVTTNGAALPGATLSVYAHAPAKHVARGAPITTATTDAVGAYALNGLAADGHYAIVEASDYVGELFDDLPCVFNNCELDGGTAIATTLGASSDGIDFDLQRVGAISGRVFEHGLGIGVEQVVVHAHAASGGEIRSVQTGRNGQYLLSGLAAGNYFLRFTHAQFDAELYDDQPCTLGNCDVTAGHAVAVTAATTTSGIDAALRRNDGTPPSRTVIYLNNCKPSGCVVSRQNVNDSRNNFSSIAQGTLAAYSGTDETWAAFMLCVKDVMAPYYVDVTDIDPGSVTPHHEAMIAGTPTQLGFSNGVAGVSPFTCGVINNSITFTFANLDPNNLLDLCWTATHEIAHSFGLSHEMHCPDSMTYLTGCGFKRYTDVLAVIGTQGACQPFQECQCGPTQQNAHQSMLGALGPNVFVFTDSFEDDPVAKLRLQREQLMQTRGKQAPLGTCATMDVAVGRRGFVLPNAD